MWKFIPEVIPDGDDHQDVYVLPQMCYPQVCHEPRNHNHMSSPCVYYSFLIEHLHNLLHRCGRWHPKPLTLHLVQVEEIILCDLH